MKKKQLVPNAPGWWWTWSNPWQSDGKPTWDVVEVRDVAGRLEYVYMGDMYLVSEEDVWGGRALPPKWTPKTDEVKP